MAKKEYKSINSLMKHMREKDKGSIQIGEVDKNGFCSGVVIIMVIKVIVSTEILPNLLITATLMRSMQS